jgi:hypothetical protein
VLGQGQRSFLRTARFMLRCVAAAAAAQGQGSGHEGRSWVGSAVGAWGDNGIDHHKN